LTEPKPAYTVPWRQAIEIQEQVIVKGVDPIKVDKLRQSAIALVRACDDLLFDDKGHTIPERQR
jgi:hypothetical protein